MVEPITFRQTEVPLKTQMSKRALWHSAGFHNMRHKNRPRIQLSLNKSRLLIEKESTVQAQNWSWLKFLLVSLYLSYNFRGRFSTTIKVLSSNINVIKNKPLYTDVFIIPFIQINLTRSLVRGSWSKGLWCSSMTTLKVSHNVLFKASRFHFDCFSLYP